jgi:hypothetical protein
MESWIDNNNNNNENDNGNSSSDEWLRNREEEDRKKRELMKRLGKRTTPTSTPLKASSEEETTPSELFRLKRKRAEVEEGDNYLFERRYESNHPDKFGSKKQDFYEPILGSSDREEHRHELLVQLKRAISELEEFEEAEREIKKKKLEDELDEMYLNTKKLEEEYKKLTGNKLNKIEEESRKFVGC